MLVVKKMNHPAVGNVGKLLRHVGTAVALEFNRAYKIIARSGFHPHHDPVEKFFGITHEVAEQPIGFFPKNFWTGIICDFYCGFSLVH